MDRRKGEEARGTALGKPAEEGESPVPEGRDDRAGSGVPRDTGNLVGSRGGPPPKAKYYPVTDSAQYREGKVKRTPGGE